MDIHKPKPWHGVREFLKEYVIIVIGVLTALGAEQAVEWLHGRELGRQADEDLAAGLKPDILNAAELWAMAPCGEARIKVLADRLQEPGGAWRGDPWPTTGAPRPVARVYLQPGYLWAHAGWEAAVNAGVLVHMPRERVARYAEAYRVVELIRDRQIATTPPIMSLVPLAYDRTLSDGDKAHYLNSLGAMDDYLVNMAGLSLRLMREGQDLDIAVDRKALATFLERQRQQRGACVRNLPQPLPAP